jgi:hypothetical protein
MADSNKRGRRSARLKLFLFLGLVCLAVLAVFGIVIRSTKTEKLQEQANQVSTQHSTDGLRGETGEDARQYLHRSARPDPSLRSGAGLRPNQRLSEEMVL